MGLPITARGYSWTHADRDRPAVGPLDFEIAAGEKVLLLGPSGAGKSTLLHAIAGVLPEESGHAGGELIVDDAAPDPRRGEIGLVLQDPESQVIFSRVGDDIAFGMENLGLPAGDIADRIPASLSALGLDLDPDHPTAALSGGQKQRLALAGIHAMAPQVIALDEPTANIDPASTAEVRDAILTVQADTSATMVLVEHQVQLWLDHVDRVIVLGRQGLLAEGPPRQIFADSALAQPLRSCGIWVTGLSEAAAGHGHGHGQASSKAPLQNRPEAQPHLPAVDEVLLRAEGLSVARPRMKSAAATGIELEIRAGRALGIVGGNGVGKSTTALTLAGLLPEFAGQVRAEAKLREGMRRARPFAWPSAALAPRIGMVFQEPAHQFLASTVTAELALGPRLAGWSSAEVDDRVSELLEMLDLVELTQAHPQSLSGGQKRRLSVAAMHAARPRVLIVDEPTFGQDALTWAGLVELFCDALDHGSAVVAVSHDPAFLAAIGAQIFDLGGSSGSSAGDSQVGGIRVGKQVE